MRRGARIAGSGEAEHELGCLGVGEAVFLVEGAPGVEAERERDCCSEGIPLSAADGPGLEENVGRLAPVLVVGRHHGVVAGVGEGVAEHLLGGAVVSVGLAERRAQPFFGIRDRPPAFGVRWRVALEVLAAAGACERQLVGEVAIDGYSSDAGAVGDLADRCCVGADRLVQLDRRLDDSLPRLVLAFGTAFERVRASHDNDDTDCLLKLDSRRPVGVASPV